MRVLFSSLGGSVDPPQQGQQDSPPQAQPPESSGIWDPTSDDVHGTFLEVLTYDSQG